MKKTRLLGIVALAALLFTSGCDQSSSEQPDVEAVAASPDALDAPVAAENINLAYKIVTGPSYNAASDTAVFEIQVVNNGKAMLVSAGSLPVHLGVVIKGGDGTMDTAPASLDFVRIRLPTTLKPGDSLTLPVEFKVAPTIGGTVVLDAVQEQVSWFSGYGLPTLALGVFKRCHGADNTLCLMDDTEAPPAQ